MNLYKKGTLVLLLFIPLLIFLFLSESLPSNKKTNVVDTTNNTQEIDNETKEAVDLYELYFSLKSKKKLNTLSTDEVTAVEEKLSKFYLDEVLNTENVIVSLYDVWLYTQTIKIIDTKLNFKKEVMRFLDSVSSDKGFYLSSSSENMEQDDIGYLLSTKMALEIYIAYEEPIPNASSTKDWILSLCEKLMRSENQDFITFGDQLVLIKDIGSFLYQINKEDIFNEKDYINLTTVVNESLNTDIDNIQEYNTLIDLSNTFEIDIEDKTDGFESYMKSVQLPDGSFPIYGEINQPSDVLTTYLFINTSNELGLTVPNYEQLNSYLSKSLQ